MKKSALTGILLLFFTCVALDGVWPSLRAEEVPIADFYVSRVAELVNKERVAHKREKLILDRKLNAAARQRASELVEKYSHTRPDDRDFKTVLVDRYVPYKAAGENIARSSRKAEPEEVVRIWMNSSAQRDIILKPGFRHFGVGVVRGNNEELYWVQLFTSP